MDYDNEQILHRERAVIGGRRDLQCGHYVETVGNSNIEGLLRTRGSQITSVFFNIRLYILKYIQKYILFQNTVAQKWHLFPDYTPSRH